VLVHSESVTTLEKIQPMEKLNKIKVYIINNFIKGVLSNLDMVEIIQLCGGYLNLMTISAYAKENNMSYEGVKKCRNIIVLFGNKYVIDND